ncbi:MAG TPA: MarR family transcriptional regulator [Actinomycetales bacterium]|nr:MarR family transcriptional regulator [Actinomycetales bacterium]
MTITTESTDSVHRTVDAFAAVAADIAFLKRELGRTVPGLGCPTAVQVGALAVLAHLDRSGPTRLTHVARCLRVDLSVVSRHVKVLEDHGFVQRTTDAEDRRAHQVSVTGEGRGAVQKLRDAAATQLSAVLAGWDDDDVATLRHLLDRLHHDLTARPTRADVLPTHA